MSDLELTVVPKDLYYHEARYVRELERKVKLMEEARLELESIREAWCLQAMQPVIDRLNNVITKLEAIIP